MKVEIKTLGCKVNQYESQAVAGQFEQAGCKLNCPNPDICIINTCAITKTAEQKSKKMLSQARKKHPRAIIAACGCLAQSNPGQLKQLGADFVIPQKEKHNITKIILGSKQLSGDIWGLEIKKYRRQRALLKIQDGCDAFCTFCKIPYLRPKPSSRKKEAILKEIEALSLNHKEIILCGINIALYGKDFRPQQTLSQLVEKILNLDCLGRLRLSSLQPRHIDSRLIKLISHPKLCPHLHLSFQYGENSILKAMNKKETVELYLEKVAALKKINPLLAISCDIIVGFPGETEKTFVKTVYFLEKIKPMRMHIFPFSPRPMTPLAGFIPLEAQTIKKRCQILNQMAKRFAFEYYSHFMAKPLEMISEEHKKGFTAGYTQNYIKVMVKEKIKLGYLKTIKITKVNQENQVFGEPCK